MKLIPIWLKVHTVKFIKLFGILNVTFKSNLRVHQKMIFLQFYPLFLILLIR